MLTADFKVSLSKPKFQSIIQVFESMFAVVDCKKLNQELNSASRDTTQDDLKDCFNNMILTEIKKIVTFLFNFGLLVFKVYNKYRAPPS